MERSRQGTNPADFSARQDSIPRLHRWTARAALSFMRFDRLQPSPSVVRHLRPVVADGLLVHRRGSRERGNALEDRTRAASDLAEEDDSAVGGNFENAGQ